MKLYAFLFCFIPSLCFAQVDSSYIGFYTQKLAVKGYLSKSFLSMGRQNGSDEELMYLPNNPLSIGAGFAINNSVISFSYGYGFDFLRDRNLGKTRAFDFQFHNYGQKIVFDIFIQRYRGFYLDDNRPNSVYQLYPDLRVRQYGAFGQYVFNNKKFSYRAAFEQNQKQLKSAGSFLLGGGIYFTKIQSDSLSFFDKNSHQNFQFGVSAGYAYTWVISPKWFVSASTTVGVNFGCEKFQKFGSQKLEVYPTVFPRVSAGYNQEDWSVGFSYVNNIIFPSFSENSNISLHSGRFQFTYIKRLHTVPFFSKLLK